MVYQWVKLNNFVISYDKVKTNLQDKMNLSANCLPNIFSSICTIFVFTFLFWHKYGAVYDKQYIYPHMCLTMCK